jgi:hypothetical protein
MLVGEEDSVMTPSTGGYMGLLRPSKVNQLASFGVYQVIMEMGYGASVRSKAYALGNQGRYR